MSHKDSLVADKIGSDRPAYHVYGESMAGRTPAPVVEEPPLSAAEEAIIGQHSVRIHLEFRNSYKARKAAELLAGLATRLQALSRRNDLTEAERLFNMAQNTRHVRNQIRKLAENPPKNERFRDEQL